MKPKTKVRKLRAWIAYRIPPSNKPRFDGPGACAIFASKGAAEEWILKGSEKVAPCTITYRYSTEAK